MNKQGGIGELDVFVVVDDGAFDQPETGRLGKPPEHVGDQGWTSGGGDQASVPPPPPLSRLLTIERLFAAPATLYIVRGVLPSMGLIALFGPPGSGKSFLAMDLVLAVASGQPDWFGRRLKQAPVAYLALEGQGGIARRIKAWMAHTRQLVPSNVRFFTGGLSLLNGSDAQAIAREIKQELGDGTVIVVDTLSRASPGGDENSSVDMTRVIEDAQVLGDIVQGPVILVHHTGKDAGKGLRGHSSLLGAVDSAIEVIHLNGCRSWRVTKAKEDEAGAECPFELVAYVIDKDQWGDDLRSCAVRPSLGGLPRPLPRISGKNQIAVMSALRQALAGTTGGCAWPQAIIQAAAALASVPSGRRNAVAKDTLERLIRAGHLQLNEGILCLP